MTIVLLVLGVLIVAGVPMSIALLGASVVYFLLDPGPNGIMAQRIVSGIQPFPLLAIPFFVLAGVTMANGGIARRHPRRRRRGRRTPARRPRPGQRLQQRDHGRHDRVGQRRRGARLADPGPRDEEARIRPRVLGRPHRIDRSHRATDPARHRARRLRLPGGCLRRPHVPCGPATGVVAGGGAGGRRQPGVRPARLSQLAREAPPAARRRRAGSVVRPGL